MGKNFDFDLGTIMVKKLKDLIILNQIFGQTSVFSNVFVVIATEIFLVDIMKMQMDDVNVTLNPSYF